MGAINLASAHSDQIGERYFMKSKIRDMILGKSNLEFDGNRKVIVHTPDPLPINQYQRSGSLRYGEPYDATDSTQEFELKYEWAFNGVYDKLNTSDSAALEKQSHLMMRDQQDRSITPAIDRMALFEVAHHAGIVKTTSTFDKDSIHELISSAETDVFNESMTDEGEIFLLISASSYHILRNCPAYLQNDKISADMIKLGRLGEICNCQVKRLPDSYMPNNVHFMIVRKDAAFAHEKIFAANSYTDYPNIAGLQLQGAYYTGAGVRQEKNGGVFVLAKSGFASAAPTLSKSGNAVSSSAAASGYEIRYTTDGTDPRYSASANVYGSAVTCASGTVFKAACVPILSGILLPEDIAGCNLKYASGVAEIKV